MKILVVLILLCIKYVNADYCLTDPATQGSPFTITQYVDKSDVVNGVLKWKLKKVNGGTWTTLTCYINYNPPCHSTSLYTGTMATYGSDEYKVTLTSKRMFRLRDQATWSWYGGSDDSIGQCDLPVYSFPCDDNIQVSSDGRMVEWTCIVDKVYPEMECQFVYRKGTSGNFMTVPSDRVTSDKVTTNGDYPPRSVYHRYTCVMNLPISGLTGAGSYQFVFRGEVRVDVKGGVKKTEFTESGLETLTLALPQVELVDCPTPQDYIKEGVTKTCGCRIKTQGTPPGQPVWRGSNGNIVGNDGSNGVKYLPLNYNSQDQNPTYYCRGVSPLGSGPDITYTPTFAYGPSQMYISFNSNNKVTDSIKKCEETTSFTTYCDIAIVNANPKPTMMVTSSDGSLITPQPESTPTGFYRYKYKVVPKRGGIRTITCQATNAIFSDLTMAKSKTITVQEPPPSAPVMTATISNNEQTVENGGTVTVTSGDPVQVKCRVDGGFPVVREVTTVCARVKNVKNGIEATQTVIVKTEDNNEKCSCEADHVTGCYHKTSEFTLNVQYTPSMTGFKANSESQELTVSADETVTFVCDVEGNPRPTVSVKGQSSGGIVTLSNAPSGSYGQRSTGSKVMSCQDTDEYRCVADNGIGDGVARTVSVFVECVPELPSGVDQAVKLLSPINGTYLIVTIPIIGYPEPKEYTLTKVGNQNRRRKTRAVTGDRIVDEILYNVIYAQDQLPKGKVVLTMFGMTGYDNGQYVLNIDNGIGKGFDYTFNVTIKEDSAVDEDDDDSSLGTGIGIGLGIGLVVALVLYVIVFFVRAKVQKMRSSKENEKAPTRMMSQHPQQQQPQQQQPQTQVEQEEEEEDGLHYQEIPADNYEMFNVNDVSQESERHRNRSQGYLYDVPKNNDKEDEPKKHQKTSQGHRNAVTENTSQEQHENEASSHNQRIQLNDNNTVYANDTHQKYPQRYLNVTISPQGIDNPAHEDNSRPMTHPGIYQGMSSDQPYNDDIDGLYVEAD